MLVLSILLSKLTVKIPEERFEKILILWDFLIFLMAAIVLLANHQLCIG